VKVMEWERTSKYCMKECCPIRSPEIGWYYQILHRSVHWHLSWTGFESWRHGCWRFCRGFAIQLIAGTSTTEILYKFIRIQWLNSHVLKDAWAGATCVLFKLQWLKSRTQYAGTRRG
jgi:hypothetical protein